ncbi:M16 family metallopeptidase [Aeoliella mucimassa]|uniref:Protease 3 n=1 Tax=Aeoliella mucimassa TaxID=2527972 RepID=A0A518AQ15_9BACT|nr:pitrilysin family protein [Aeoliella mucimassa]QDU56805.1 Protease 3 precursor [Aeoliella mucimassa]
MEFRSHRLENGLEIVAECNPEALSMGLGFFVRTGSRDETSELAGISHFLEHMVFKGTPRRSADDVNREFDEIGAHYNAFTSEESTVYYASVLPECQSAALDILADIMRPSLRESDFEMEKKVIVEEIQMYLDQPPYGMDDRIKQLCFGDHPIANSVIGSEQSVTALTPEQMLLYHRDRYSADNLFIAAAGKVDFDALVAQVEELCGAWESSGAERVVPPARLHPLSECKVNSTCTQEYVLQLRNGPAAGDHDRFAAKLLTTVIGDDSGSRMYWDLVDPGLVESASLGHYEYQGVGMFYTWLACEPEDTADNLARLQAIYEKVEREGLEAEELQQAKNKVKARVVLGNERPRSRLFSVGGNWLQRREYRSITDDLQAVDAVTLDDLLAVLAKYPLSQHSTAAVGPLSSIAGL